jgi:hypothetical protein
MNMDGVYVSNSVNHGASSDFDLFKQYKTYSQRINIQGTEILRCYRNGISVVNGSDISIIGNTFRFITGWPGAAIDVEPDRVEAHAENIQIRENTVEDCFTGIALALHWFSQTSPNAWGMEVSANRIRRIRTVGILVSEHYMSPTISLNEIIQAYFGIYLSGTTGARVVQNTIYTLRSCSTGIAVVDQSIPSSSNYFYCNKTFRIDAVSGSATLCSSDAACGL